jgi:hypothetical protein
MEHENKFASKGVAGAGLGLGIAGTALGLMAGNGGLGNLFGGANCGCNEDHLVNRYELGMQQEIAAKDTKISLLESNIYTDAKIADVYERLNTKFENKYDCLEKQICAQSVINAQVTANLACMQGNINTLMGLTKTVIPITSVCPEPMPAANSWVAPTTTATT